MRAPSAKTTITVWLNYWPLWPELIDPVRERAAEFSRAHPEYEVVVHGVNVRDLPREVVRTVNEGAGPTIAAYQYTYLQDAVDARDALGNPIFTSVSRAIGGRSEILGEPVVLDDVMERARAYYTIEGDLSSMPRNTSTVLLYSNVEALRAAGFDEPPTTWAEVEAVCAAVGKGITWPNFGWFFQQSVAQQGGLLADHDNGRSGRAEKVHLDSPEMLAYVTWWRDLHRAGHYRYTGKLMDWPGCQDVFTAGEVAMLLSSSVEAGPIVQAAPFEVRVSRMPYNDRVPYAGNLVAGESLWLRAGLDDATRDGALAFMQFLTSPRNATSIHDHGRTFVPTTEASLALLESEGWFAEHPHYRAAIEQIRLAGDSPATRGAVFGNFLPIQNLTAQAMHEVLTEDADPVARFGRATTEAQALLDAYAREHAR
jgi:sn-glycerol 3-phosphate transport system substrate-binding protein